MDTEHNQGLVAYESAPKEVNTERRVPSSNTQFGKAKRMVQDNKGYVQPDWPANPGKRGGEYR